MLIYLYIPQMNPMNWILLYLYMYIIFYLLACKIHFFK